MAHCGSAACHGYIDTLISEPLSGLSTLFYEFLYLSDLKQQVGARLRAAIDAKYKGKWTAFAREAHISDGTVKRWLDGLSVPGGEHLVNISSVLDVSADWLLTGKGPNAHQTEQIQEDAVAQIPNQATIPNPTSPTEKEVDLVLTELGAWMRRIVMRRPESLEQISAGVRRLINDVEGVSAPTGTEDEQNKASPPTRAVWGATGEGG